MDVFPDGIPTRAMLDSVVPDRPVLLTNRDGHGAWVNSRALDLAGVDRHTPDPADGRIEREPDGTPVGTLQEGAMDLVGALVPVATPQEARAGLLAAQQHLFSLGITAWQDAMIGVFPGNPDNYSVYVDAARDGSLQARVVGALWWDRDRGTEQIPDLVGAAPVRPGRAASTPPPSRSCRTASPRTSPRACSPRTSTAAAAPPPTPV